MPLKYVFITAAASLVFWCGGSVIFKSKNWRIFNLICFTLAFGAIIYRTLVSRTPNESVILILTPFKFIEDAKIQPEIYRSVIMNAFLFLPAGLSLPYILPKKLKYKPAISMLLLLLVSFFIELIQYKFSLGKAETDDIIFNTLGGLAGAVPYILRSEYMRRMKNGKT